MNTTEGNKLIMLFDGWVLKPFQTFDPRANVQIPGSNTYYAYVKDGSTCRDEDVEFDIVYHQSWNALMSVVEKIEKLNYDTEVHGIMTTANEQGDYHYYARIADWWGKEISKNENNYSKIEATWQTVVQFIQWHNTFNQ